MRHPRLARACNSFFRDCGQVAILLLQLGMAKIPKEVASYYSSQSGIHKDTLMEMRNRILQIIPGATEIIKYSMPTFMHEGNEVAGLLANKNHIGYYPYSGFVISKFPEIEAKYTTTKGALHVPLGKPLAKSRNQVHLMIRTLQYSVLLTKCTSPKHGLPV